MRGPDRRYPDDVPDPSLAQQRLQRLDLQMMAAVMSDQRFDAALAHFRDQGGRRLERIGDRLLDQDMNAAPRAFDAGLGMKLIGGSDDHSLWPRFVEQLAVIREDARLGVLGGDRVDIDIRDTDQIIVAVLGELAQMLASDQPRADHADGDIVHVTSRAENAHSAPLVVDVDEHGAEQHQALDHLLVVDADAEDRHAVVHHAHDEARRSPRRSPCRRRHRPRRRR